MRLDWGKWLYGLISGFIGGGAGAVSAGFAGIFTDPEHFNPANGVRHLFTLMGVTFLFSGVMSAVLYLKQSPLPQEREVWTDAQREAAKANGGQK